jgi:hypothetical protein
VNAIRTFPGARPPDRHHRIDADGVGIAVNEWGDQSDPILMLVHGGADFSRTFDVFAPLLADAGWRVIAWDHRGHGDSDHTHLYSYDADLRDAVRVFETFAGHDPTPNPSGSKRSSISTASRTVVPDPTSPSINEQRRSPPSWPGGSLIADAPLTVFANPERSPNWRVAGAR